MVFLALCFSFLEDNYKVSTNGDLRNTEGGSLLWVSASVSARETWSARLKGKFQGQEKMGNRKFFSLFFSFV